MTGSSSKSCCNFLTSLILTKREIPLEYKLMACFPNAFAVFSPFSFSSHCLYSAYVLLIISSLALSTLPYVHLCSNKCALPLSMIPLILLVFYVAQCLPLVYQQHRQNHHLICLQHQPLSLLNVEIATI